MSVDEDRCFLVAFQRDAVLVKCIIVKLNTNHFGALSSEITVRTYEWFR